jgi:hypothetical protein
VAPDASTTTILIDGVTADNIINAMEAAGTVTLTGAVTNLPFDAATRRL